MSPGRVIKRDATISRFKPYVDRLGEAVDKGSRVSDYKELLIKASQHEIFFTETDLKSGGVSWEYGVKECLGYSIAGNDLLSKSFDQKVHPMVREWYYIYVRAVMWLFTQANTRFLESRFTITVPVQQQDGHYVLCKQTSMPFAYDKNNRLVSFLNTFSIFGPFRGEPLTLRIYLGNKDAGDKMYAEMEKLICRSMEVPADGRLSKDQFLIIDIFNELKTKGGEVRPGIILKKFHERKTKKIKEKSTRGPYRRIKDQLNWILGLDPFPADDKINYRREYLPDFKNTLRLIDFCEESGILKYLRKYAQK